MKKIILISIFIATVLSSFAQVSINTDGSDPNSHAMLDVKSTDKGILIPRLTSLQRVTLGSNLTFTENGLLVYDTDKKCLYYWNQSFWKDLNPESYWGTQGNYPSTLDSIILGTRTAFPLDIYTNNTLFLKLTTTGRLETMNIGNSVFLGKGAGFSDDTTNNYNVYIGDSAAYKSNKASHSIAIGNKALYSFASTSPTYSENIALGSKALLRDTAGYYNEAIGNKSQYYNAKGSQNISIGRKSLFYNVGGHNNTAIGNAALGTPYSSLCNTAIGSYAMSDMSVFINNTNASNLPNNTSAFNVAVGFSSLASINDSARYNTAVGAYALGAVNSNHAQGNTVMGYKAMEGSYFGNAGDYNVAIGTNSLKYATGDNNTILGAGALGGTNNIGTYTSNRNTIIGSEAGYSSGHISGCVFIGYQAGAGEINNNKLYIENSNSSIPLIEGDFANNWVLVNGDFGCNGTLTVRDGTQGVGKILTSDATGIASWTSPSWGSEINDLTDASYDGYSLFLGNNTGINDDGANNNMAVGVSALKTNISGTNNTAVGNQAGNQTTGSGSVFIGYQAGYNETGSNKLYIANSNTSTPLIGGDFASSQVEINGTIKITGGAPSTGKVLTSDANGLASWQLTSGATKIDDLSDAKTTIGSCVFLGINAGASITSGTGNSALGCEALNAVTTGSRNIASGYHALYHTTSGEHNTAIGFNAYNTNTTGNHNTVLGYYAGFSSTGSDNIFLGYQAGYNEAGSNKLYIANSNTTTPLIGGDFSTSQVDINGTIKITGGSPGANKVLTSDANGLASWSTPQIGAQQIDDLSDVDVTTSSPTNGQILGWDGTNWVPTNDNNTVYSAGTGLQLLGTIFSLNSGIDNLNDVDVSTTTPVSGQVLSWDGSNWIPTNDQGATNINELSDGKNDNSSIFVGTNAGATDDGTANLNAGFGNGALSLNSTGGLNTAIGSYAMNANTSGVENLAIGAHALYNNQTGNKNTVIGRGAGLQAVGSANVFIGYRAGNGETGSNKLYIANSATTSPLIGGDFSIAQVDINGTIKITGGSPGNGKVLTSNATGLASWQAPTALTIAINDLTDGKTVSNSVYLGPGAGQNNTSTGNTALGNSALYSNTSGVNNTTIGAGAFAYSSSGDSNTVVGYMAGVFDASGNPTTNLESSILIGSRTRVLSTGDLNEIVIGMGVTGLGSNTVTLGDTNIVKTALYGKVGIGTTTPQSTLEVNGGVKVANDADAASASKVGTLRYRSDSNNSYVEMCVQTGASSYAWKVIHQETW